MLLLKRIYISTALFCTKITSHCRVKKAMDLPIRHRPHFPPRLLFLVLNPKVSRTAAAHVSRSSRRHTLTTALSASSSLMKVIVFNISSKLHPAIFYALPDGLLIKLLFVVDYVFHYLVRNKFKSISSDGSER
ncbi:hypothetical protein PUN28_001601 [Cardiocondyla obscurior]|uniref:Uncharacterized protein n=1 Tax=Cardiocondyla obscurior TaxID=286306 RepID=A0AAW2GQ95_9HYME